MVSILPNSGDTWVCAQSVRDYRWDQEETCEGWGCGFKIPGGGEFALTWGLGTILPTGTPRSGG